MKGVGEGGVVDFATLGREGAEQQLELLVAHVQPYHTTRATLTTIQSRTVGGEHATELRVRDRALAQSIEVLEQIVCLQSTTAHNRTTRTMTTDKTQFCSPLSVGTEPSEDVVHGTWPHWKPNRIEKTQTQSDYAFPDEAGRQKRRASCAEHRLTNERRACAGQTTAAADRRTWRRAERRR